MNIHKSDGISKKAFKKHNSIDGTKVTIEELNNSEDEMSKHEIKTKISGIRRPGAKIVNHIHKLDSNSVVETEDFKKDVEQQDDYKKNNIEFEKEIASKENDIVFDTEDEKDIVEESVNFDKEVLVEEDNDIVFDAESDKDNKGHENKLDSKIQHAEINNINEADNIDKNTKKVKDKKIKERKLKKSAIINSIESFEEKEKDLVSKSKDLNEEIGEIIQEQENKIIKSEKKKNLKIAEKNVSSSEEKVEENNDLDNLESEDEDGLIIKESSEFDKKLKKNKSKSKIDEDTIDFDKTEKNNKFTNENDKLVTHEDNHSRNLLIVIIAIVILIGILIGGFIFYKKNKAQKQHNEVEISIEKEKKENIQSKETKKQENEKDVEKQKQQEVKNRKLFSNCDYLSNNLSSCTPYKCKFEHPDTHEIMKREVYGVTNDKCKYSETLTNKKVLICNFEEKSKNIVSEFYKKNLSAKFIAQADLDKDLVNGIDNSIKKMIKEGVCNIEENTEVISGECPEDKEFKGEYNNEGKLMPICLESNIECKECLNCTNDKQKVIINRIEGKGECKDCSETKDCKEGFHCFNSSCVKNEVLLNELTCSDDNNNCKKLPCKDCLDGNKYCNVGKKDWKQDLKNKCVDCTDTKYCKEGFKCENYKCIAK